MRRPIQHTRSFLRATLVGALALTALTIADPEPATAGLVVRAAIKAPVRATVCVGDAPRVGVLVRPSARRTVVTRAPTRCCCPRDHHPEVRVRRHHRHHPQMVWVPGHWERVSRRTSRWIPGHWERI